MNLLITGATYFNAGDCKQVEGMGNNVYYLQNENEDLPCNVNLIEGIIGNNVFAYHPIELFSNLKYIQLTSAGFDRVPLEYIKAHNIVINNAGGVYSIPMAEFAFCGVMELLKHKQAFFDNQKKRIWSKDRNLIEMFGLNCLIIGCGSVGEECAKRFKAFGCNVYGVDNYKVKSEHFNLIKDMNHIDELIKIADIIVLSLPLTDETKYLFDANKIILMKKNAILVNIARGKIINEKDLIDNLNNIGGAVLDVFEDEPLSPDNPLWDKENVIITPHNSFVGNNNKSRLLRLTIKNLTDYLG